MSVFAIIIGIILLVLLVPEIFVLMFGLIALFFEFILRLFGKSFDDDSKKEKK